MTKIIRMPSLRKLPKRPRQYSWVKFDFDNYPSDYINEVPFKKDSAYIFFGDIPNMPGHCIVCDRFGEFIIGYHTDNFIELSIDET